MLTHINMSTDTHTHTDTYIHIHRNSTKFSNFDDGGSKKLRKLKELMNSYFF